MKPAPDARGTVYLVHFSDRTSENQQHYLGWSADVGRRFVQHASGRGAHETRKALAEGLKIMLAQTWSGTPDLERRIKLWSRCGAKGFAGSARTAIGARSCLTLLYASWDPRRTPSGGPRRLEPRRPPTGPSCRSAATATARKSPRDRCSRDRPRDRNLQIRGDSSGSMRNTAAPRTTPQSAPESQKPRSLGVRPKRGTEESNLALRFWRPPCYRYTSPPRAPNCRC